MSIFLKMPAIADLFKFFRLNKPLNHPLVAVIDFSQVDDQLDDDTKISADFYCLLFKNYNRNNVRYGRKVVDFNDGSLICMAPNQVIEMENDNTQTIVMEGWGLFFHPDLIRGTSLNDKMKDYSFFSYEISEALHMSEKEKQIYKECIQKIETELQENIDVHSQAIIISNIELLLNYCQRFYGRQFITRKSANSSVVMQVEKILKEYFKNGKIDEQGLPTVKSVAEKVNLSPGYLSDLLKRETGKNTQDHIHFYLIEEAKNMLIDSERSVSEIAYLLGFEYPQYFNKLFKQKTGKTPLSFRSMN
ncbi:helix-turn-helix domain-containing protein [Mucilaginibacter litoreus]|uniref:Helix-turn-helix domain-containing protein n=1 Tax=Mucilaginibacter litoreus TaxID=1048221 RepID=A0ABW3AU57_9SPHI